MDHLTALDASFLEVEDADPHVSLAIGAVSVMEGPVPDYDEFVAVFAERIRAIPRCTQILRSYPLDLGSPAWVQDRNFDVSRHLHRVALPQPGGDAELFEMIATVMERRLDRERPLWECWRIEGLSGDRWALLSKIHHCIADGIATTQIMAKFADDDAAGSFVTDIRVAREHDGPGARPRALSLNPLRWVSGMGRGALAAATAAEHAAVGAAELAASLLSPAPGSSLSGPMTTRRRYGVARVRLADMAQVCHVFGVTLNDVALAAITDSYRRILLSRGEHPAHSSLRTLVPVSIREVNLFSTAHNEVSAMLPLLPVDEADPVKQLLLVHRRLTSAKDSGQREGGGALLAAAKNVPFTFSAWMVRLFARLPQRSVVALATNVPGPRGHQTLMGCRVLEILPVPPIALALRTGIAMVSYADGFTFGITADYDTTPDIDALATGIEDAVARLVAAGRAHRRRRTSPAAL